MDGIALSWILRITELESVLHGKQQALEEQHGRLQEAERLLGQTLEEQERFQQSAFDVQLAKAQLQCDLFTHKVQTRKSGSTLVSDSAVRQQKHLEQILAKKCRIAAKMKQEQMAAQAFSKMMHSHQLQQDQTVKALQSKLSEHQSFTQQVEQETAREQKKLAEAQRNEVSLRAMLAQSQQDLKQRQEKAEQASLRLQGTKDANLNEFQKVQAQLVAEQKLYQEILAEGRQAERRLCQEQAISKALLDRQHQLQTQMEQIKQAILVLSE